MYLLTAKRNGWEDSISIEADDDRDAIWEAISLVMYRAFADHNKNDLWAKGQITLRNPAGEVIHEMLEKE